MKVQIYSARTLPNEENDCFVEAFAKATGIHYGKVWKVALAKFGRKVGQTIRFRPKTERCGTGSDFKEFGHIYKWTSLPKRTKVSDLSLPPGSYVLDICCADSSFGGHHLAAVVDNVLYDNAENIGAGVERGTVVGYWRVAGKAKGLVASATPERVGELVDHPEGCS